LENVILSLAKESIVGAGFFILLWYLIQNMSKIAEALNTFGETLQKVSETLLKIDMRNVEILDRLKERGI
jgi:uncharacterized protein YoxC